MDILVVDPLSGKGHTRFNKSIIDALGKKIILMSSLDMLISLNKLNVTYKKSIHLPNLNKKRFRRIISLFNHIYPIYIAKKYNKKIIFLSFDNISIFICLLLQLKIDICICHNNIDWIRSNILKRKIYYFIQKRSNIIYLNKLALNYVLSKLDNHNLIHYLRHPLSGFKINQGYQNTLLFNSFCEKNRIDNYSYYIFWPGGINSNNDIIHAIINNKRFIDFLIDKNVLFIGKFGKSFVNVHNTFNITKYIEDDVWQAILVNVDLAIIKYNYDFKFRSSSVVASFVSNNKRILTYPSFLTEDYKEYNNIYNFNTIHDLIKNIEFYLTKEISNTKYFSEDDFLLEKHNIKSLLND